MTNVQVPTMDSDGKATQFFQTLMDRSAIDQTFRAKLLSTPRSAIAEFSGIAESDLPASVDVHFVENTARATFVLPDPAGTSGELSDGQLETVSGGCWWLLVGAGIMLAKEVYEAYQDGQAAKKH